jgi:hypothetical protein
MRHQKGFNMRKFVLATGIFFGGMATAQAVQPLHADLNPANYTPYVDYYDTGSQQTFYYDGAAGSFFVRLAPATQPLATTTVPAGYELVYGGNDQSACQAKANYLAATGVLSHGNYTIGAFEGIGVGGNSLCDTCVPGGAMSLSGDASALSATGMWYRVRAWR